MRLKTDWLPHLHETRRRELELIFSRFEPGCFDQGLELGAGDGFQSTLLTRYVRELTCTELSSTRLRRVVGLPIKYRICDAESIDQDFAPNSFDLIYSSNLLEHLPKPGKALRAIHRTLRHDGITIHVMPSRFWKLCHLALYNPNRAVWVIERLLSGEFGQGRLQVPLIKSENNLKLERPRERGLFLPIPHGVADSNWEELQRFGKLAWKREFERAGFHVLAILKGPVSSGYGFGFDRLRRVLEKMGLTSEYVYVAEKAGCFSRVRNSFRA